MVRVSEACFGFVNGKSPSTERFQQYPTQDPTYPIIEKRRLARLPFVHDLTLMGRLNIRSDPLNLKLSLCIDEAAIDICLMGNELREFPTLFRARGSRKAVQFPSLFPGFHVYYLVSNFIP